MSSKARYVRSLEILEDDGGNIVERVPVKLFLLKERVCKGMGWKEGMVPVKRFPWRSRWVNFVNVSRVEGRLPVKPDCTKDND